MSGYITKEERHTIEILLKMKTPVSDIAHKLGRHRSTIYKEIKNGMCEQVDTQLRTYKIYLHDFAQKKHDDSCSRKGRLKKLASDDPFLKDVSDWILNKKYSPAAALYKLNEHKVCVRTIYNYVHSGNIDGVTVLSLPYAKPKKKKKEEVVKRSFSRGTSIEERPDYISDRLEYGHWEMDTVYSSKGDSTCLLVLSERRRREELIFKIKDRTSQSVIKVLDRLERKLGSPSFREKFKTITCDNGMEFADWTSMERSCRTKLSRTKVYFCHPYSSWERGTNENINRMIRRWVPKGDDISLYSEKEIQFIQAWINDYPRGIFNGKSSNTVE